MTEHYEMYYDSINESARRYYEKNKDIIKKKSSQYYQEHKEEILRKAREKREKEKEKETPSDKPAEKRKRYYQKVPSHLRKQNRKEKIGKVNIIHFNNGMTSLDILMNCNEHFFMEDSELSKIRKEIKKKMLDIGCTTNITVVEKTNINIVIPNTYDKSLEEIAEIMEEAVNNNKSLNTKSHE